jgi:hypothetical protein
MFIKYIVTAVQIKIKYSVPNFEWCYTQIILKQAGLHLGICIYGHCVPLLKKKGGSKCKKGSPILPDTRLLLFIIRHQDINAMKDLIQSIFASVMYDSYNIHFCT